MFLVFAFIFEFSLDKFCYIIKGRKNFSASLDIIGLVVKGLLLKLRQFH